MHFLFLYFQFKFKVMYFHFSSFFVWRKNLGLKSKVLCRRACGLVDVGTCPHQVLATTLTLSQPRGGGRLRPPYTGVHTKFWKPQERLLYIFIKILSFTPYMSWSTKSQSKLYLPKRMFLSGYFKWFRNAGTAEPGGALQLPSIFNFIK